MDEAQAQRIIDSPDFQTMARRKSGIATIFSIITLIIYFGYLLMVGINKSLFIIPISPGATSTYGIYFGLGIILFAVVITGIYVKKANGEFDVMTRKIVDDINSGKF